MLLQTICIALLFWYLQLSLYKIKAPFVFLYLLPLLTMQYFAVVIFQTIREQALSTSFLPLWGKIILYLIPLLLFLLGSLYTIRSQYRKQYPTRSLWKFIKKQGIFFMTTSIFLLFAIIYTAQSYVIFYPNASSQSDTPLRATQSMHRMNIDQYYGWCHQPENSDEMIIYFGGNAQNATDMFLQFQKQGVFQSLNNYTFLSFDYPSYGESHGSLTQTSLFHMAQQVVEAALQHHPNQKINVIGYSIGTGIASYIAAHFQLHSLILIAPYNNGKDLFNSYLPVFYGPFTSWIQYPLTSDQYVKHTTCETLILYSKIDTIVLPQLTEQLIHAFEIKPQLVQFQDKSHAQLISAKETWNAIANFLDSH